jgi:hypothetical protein
MEHLIGRLCELTFLINGKSLWFLGRVNRVDATHIYFTDKFNKEFGFRRSDLLEIQLVQAK